MKHMYPHMLINLALAIMWPMVKYMYPFIEIIIVYFQSNIPKLVIQVYK